MLTPLRASAQVSCTLNSNKFSAVPLAVPSILCMLGSNYSSQVAFVVIHRAQANTGAVHVN